MASGEIPKARLALDQDDRCRLHDRALGLDAVERAVEVEAAGVEIGRNQHRRPADAGVAMGQDRCLRRAARGESNRQPSRASWTSQSWPSSWSIWMMLVTHLDGIVSGPVVQLQMWVMLCGFAGPEVLSVLEAAQKKAVKDFGEREGVCE